MSACASHAAAPPHEWWLLCNRKQLHTNIFSWAHSGRQADSFSSLWNWDLPGSTSLPLHETLGLDWTVSRFHTDESRHFSTPGRTWAENQSVNTAITYPERGPVNNNLSCTRAHRRTHASSTLSARGVGSVSVCLWFYLIPDIVHTKSVTFNSSPGYK